MTTQPHRIVVGLGFGDEAKGATVDRLCAEGGVTAVVRFSGGPQAAHNVVVDGTHHTFRQFGSGTLAGVASYLSRYVLVSPEALGAEADELVACGVPDPLGMIAVSPDALVVTAVHRAANRTREDLRGDARHGSCGLGVGETQLYALPENGGPAAIRVRDCRTPDVLRVKLAALLEHYAPLLAQGSHEVPSLREMAVDLLEFGSAVEIVPDVAYLTAAAATGALVLEGSQGVLLDEWRGFHPHTTWSTVTPAPAQELLREAGLERGEVWGAVRSYATRHGAGPFPTEDRALRLPEAHNGYGTYQGDWRTGHLDLVLLDYAARVCRAAGGLDVLAVSHLDAEPVGVAAGYASLPLGDLTDLAHQSRLTAALLAARPRVTPLEGPVDEVIARCVGVPVGMRAYGAGRADRELLRPASGVVAGRSSGQGASRLGGRSRSGTSSTTSARTRVSMSATMRRTSASSCPLGSSSGQSR
ncbi:adenylosuccinate synthase [Nocardioides zeae]|uniref:Adenylosuccinate synthase n=1 Tax=Nocardioides zeae TaxID=1457234 RepID=A0ACC6IEK0_9ACTN|nr:adenylosuccinate synthase [Nocardioides zeae]MDR6209114.1 adenylosuccinate synthase [Nocardioides zeae]